MGGVKWSEIGISPHSFMFRSFDDKARSEVSSLGINYLKQHRQQAEKNVLKNLFKLFRLYFVNIIKVADCFFCH